MFRIPAVAAFLERIQIIRIRVEPVEFPTVHGSHRIDRSSELIILRILDIGRPVVSDLLSSGYLVDGQSGPPMIDTVESGLVRLELEWVVDIGSIVIQDTVPSPECHRLWLRTETGLLIRRNLQKIQFFLDRFLTEVVGPARIDENRFVRIRPSRSPVRRALIRIRDRGSFRAIEIVIDDSYVIILDELEVPILTPIGIRSVAHIVSLAPYVTDPRRVGITAPIIDVVPRMPMFGRSLRDSEIS